MHQLLPAALLTALAPNVLANGPILLDAGNSGMGTNYCDPDVPNSTGMPGVMSAQGSAVANDHNLLTPRLQVPDGRYAT